MTGLRDDGLFRDAETPLHRDPRYRRVLGRSAGLNLGMFVVEGAVGLLIGSAALLADAIDFLEDAGLYALGVVAVGWALRSRARAGLVMGWAMFAVGMVALGQVFVRLWYGGVPSPLGMTLVATLALAVNLTSAIWLMPFRQGDSTMRSIWLSTRNDAILNGLTILAGVLVALRAAAWPDIVAGLIIAAVNLSAALSIVRQARSELAVGK